MDTGLICNYQNYPVMLTYCFKNGVSVLLILLIAAAGAWAHPGHGESEGHSLLHYLTEPLHIVPLIAVIVFSVSIFLVMYARRKKRSVANA